MNRVLVSSWWTSLVRWQNRYTKTLHKSKWTGLLRVLQKEKKISWRQEMSHITKQHMNPVSPFGNAVPELGRYWVIASGWEWALINPLGSRAHWHSDIIYRESPARVKMTLLADVSYLLHHISSCVISSCIDTSLFLWFVATYVKNLVIRLLLCLCHNYLLLCRVYSTHAFR